MIPYETVRSHLERRHWASTDGFSWEELVVIHEAVHLTTGDNHQESLPPVQPTLYPVVVDVPTGDIL